MRFRIGRIVLFNLVAVVLILYGFEGLLRVSDPKRHLPPDGWIGGRRYTWGHSVRLNRHSFRGREWESPKRRGVYRVAVLGDSLTFGTGVAEEERFTDVLERLLREEFPKREIEVVNLGVEGAFTLMERDILHANKDRLQPDRLIVAFSVNDPRPGAQNYSVERDIFHKWLGEPIAVLSRGLAHAGLTRTGELIRKAADRFVVAAGLVPHWHEALQRAYERDSIEWRAFESALRDIKTLSDDMRLPEPVFIVLPQAIYRDRPSDYRNPDADARLYLRWSAQAQRAAAGAGFLTLSLAEEFSDEFPDSVPAVNVLDAHPPARAHRLFARKLRGVLAPHIGVDFGTVSNEPR